MSARLLARKAQLRALGLAICDGQPARIEAAKAARQEAKRLDDPNEPMTDELFELAAANLNADWQVKRASLLVKRIVARMNNLTARCKAEEEEAPHG